MQNILSQNSSLAEALASALSSAYSALQSFATGAAGSSSFVSVFQSAQQKAASVAEQAAAAISSLSAAYKELTGSAPSGTLDLSLTTDGDQDRNDIFYWPILTNYQSQTFI